MRRGLRAQVHRYVVVVHQRWHRLTTRTGARLRAYVVVVVVVTRLLPLPLSAPFIACCTLDDIAVYVPRLLRCARPLVPPVPSPFCSYTSAPFRSAPLRCTLPIE